MLFWDDNVYTEKSYETVKTNYKFKEVNLATKQSFYEAKLKMIEGNYSPLLVVAQNEINEIVKDNEYAVITIADIPNNTFICEYSGEIISGDKNIISDSLFTLLSPDECKKQVRLEIKPDYIANIAKFISGVGENTKKLINVKAIRVLIDSQPHVLLITSSNIKKGEVLYYDYQYDSFKEQTDNYTKIEICYKKKTMFDLK